jgi:hypothetical protein
MAFIPLIQVVVRAVHLSRVGIFVQPAMPSASDAGQRDPKSLLLQYVHVQRAIESAKQVRTPASVCHLLGFCCQFMTCTMHEMCVSLCIPDIGHCT